MLLELQIMRNAWNYAIELLGQFLTENKEKCKGYLHPLLLMDTMWDKLVTQKPDPDSTSKLATSMIYSKCHS